MSSLHAPLQYIGPIKLSLIIISGTGPSDWVVTLPPSPVLVALLGLDSLYFDAVGVPKQVAYSTLLDQNGPLTFGSVDKVVWAIYSEDQVDLALANILKYMGNPGS